MEEDEATETIPEWPAPSKTQMSIEKKVALLVKDKGKDIAALGKDDRNGWRRISLAVDSGACVTVADAEDIPNYPVFETRASQAGENFAAASGDQIPTLGGMKIPIITRELTARLMNVTAAPVTKPLLSVKQLKAVGHRVVFDEEGS